MMSENSDRYYLNVVGMDEYRNNMKTVASLLWVGSTKIRIERGKVYGGYYRCDFYVMNTYNPRKVMNTIVSSS